MTFKTGDQVSVYSGDNVRSFKTGEPFRYLAVITAGPVTLNTGREGYLTLGAGGEDYPFDQSYHQTVDLLPADADACPLASAGLERRYRAFLAWAYPKGAVR